MIRADTLAAFSFLLFASVLLALCNSPNSYSYFTRFPPGGFTGFWSCNSNDCGCACFSNVGYQDDYLVGPPGQVCGYIQGEGPLPGELGGEDHAKCLSNDPATGGREVACVQDPSDPNGAYRCMYKIPAGSISYCRDTNDCCKDGADCLGQGNPDVICVNHRCVLPSAAPHVEDVKLYLSGNDYRCDIKVWDQNSGDILIATYDWYKDGSIQQPLHRTKQLANDKNNYQLLSIRSKADMGVGTWHCSAKVSDGTYTTLWKDSNSVSLCLGAGEPCTTQAECCPETTGRVCSAAHNVCVACAGFGSPCDGTRDCCPNQGLACSSGRSQNICCKDTGKTCDSDSECCSGKCKDNKCAVNHPPGKPAKPLITAFSPYPPPAQCSGNCPPNPLPTDPDPGDTVSMEYQWYVQNQPQGWRSSADFYASCLSGGTYPCVSGSKITLKSRACDQLSACRESDESNALSWPGTPVAPPSTHQIDIAYLVLPLVAALLLLALAYMLSKIFSLQHWVPIIGDELLQVLATGIVALMLVSIQFALDTYLASALPAAGMPSSPSMYAAAKDRLGLLGGEINGLLDELSARSVSIGKEASKGIYCTMLGTGFTLVNCSPLNAFRGSLTAAAFSVMVGAIDIYAQRFILTLANNYAFSLLLPLGLFLRCFRLSRPAGGALIAIGFGFYSVYPLTIVAVNSMLGGLNSPFPQPARITVPDLKHGKPNPNECDPYERDVGESRKQYDAFASDITDNDLTLGIAYLVLVKAILLSIINLIITLGFIASFARLLGSDIDVSGLARIG